ncbi:MAG: hypothetical protein A3F11_05045 [Gammaproteobacteria bacterium RIFCSPHIGHO2_12_FULL_37_14]|nr:MAG: hypothetical protein A3F11_05045 [Gammaproteobacteria bacterium RIFCSPHIGHO2_12_FULL_37_14]
MTFIKTLIYHLLLSVRGIILITSKLLSLGFIVIGIVMFYLGDFQDAPLAAKILVIFFGIIFTLINWFYDYFIFYFAPKNLVTTLYR